MPRLVCTLQASALATIAAMPAYAVDGPFAPDALAPWRRMPDETKLSMLGSMLYVFHQHPELALLLGVILGVALCGGIFMYMTGWRPRRK